MFLNPFNSNATLYAELAFDRNCLREGSLKHGKFLTKIENDSYKTVIKVVFTKPLTNKNKALRVAASTLPLRRIKKMVIASGNSHLVKYVTKEAIMDSFSRPFYKNEVIHL